MGWRSTIHKGDCKRGTQMDKRQFERYSILHISDGSGTINIDDEKTKTLKRFTITRLSMEDKDNACTSFRVGLYDGTRFYPEEEHKAPAAAMLYWIREEIRITETNNLRAEVVGSTNLDRIEIYIEGFREKV